MTSALQICNIQGGARLCYLYHAHRRSPSTLQAASLAPTVRSVSGADLSVPRLLAGIPSSSVQPNPGVPSGQSILGADDIVPVRATPSAPVPLEHGQRVRSGGSHRTDEHTTPAAGRPSSLQMGSQRRPEVCS